MYLTETHRIILAATAGAVLTSTALLGVGWARGRIEDEQAKIQELDKRIAEAEGKRARIPQDEKDVIILRENVIEYVKILPEDSELTDFARTVNSFATQSGIALRSLTPSENTGRNNAFSKYQYMLAFSGTLWQFLDFANSFESYRRFVSIPTFGLSAGEPDAEGRATEDAVHSFHLTVETYTYNQRAGDDPHVRIVNYAAKRDRLREEIHRARAKIRVDQYAFSGAHARRDIFVDPRERVGSRTIPATRTNLRQQLTLVEQLTKEVRSLRERNQQAERTGVLLLALELRREVKKGIADVEARLAKLDDGLVISYNPYRLRLEREVREPLRLLRDTLDGANAKSTAGLSRATLQDMLEFMEAALLDGRISDVIAKYEVVQDGLAFTAADNRFDTARRIRDLYEKATIAQDFSRIPLDIEGLVLIDNGVSALILNGRTYQEGDAIKENLYLKEVASEDVEFVYKGLVIRKRAW